MGTAQTREDPLISQDQASQTRSSTSEPTGRDDQAHLNTLPRKLPICGGNPQPTRLHIQEQIIINGVLQLSRRRPAFSLFTLKARSETRVPLPSDDKRRQGGTAGTHARVQTPPPTGRETKAGGTRSSQPPPAAHQHPGALQMRSSFKGARRRLGDGRGPDSRPQDSEQQNEAH